MKYSLLLLSLILGLSIWFYPQISNSNGSGSPGGKTGSPGDGGSCQDCHYTGTNNGGTISTNIPSSGYIPGETYTITATVQELGISKFGFEITSEEDVAPFGKKGSFLVTNNTETQSNSFGTAITHKGSGNSGNNAKSWSMDWVAPNSGTGNITFYASFIAANGNGQNSGDNYHAISLPIWENTNINKIEEYDTKNSFTVSKNNIYINQYIKEIQIYDITGKLIINYTNLHPTEKVNLNILKQGLYIINSINRQGLLKDTKKIQIN